jgi:3-oxoacyl-[acyl-carrier protein] reductase
MEFENKVALVTGASRGIGRAIAVRLARGGATVVINFASNRSLAEEVGREITEAGGSALLCGFDVANHDAADQEISRIVGELGGLHILVNNAGITRDGLLIRMKEQDWDDVISTNLKGIFNTSKAAAKQMIKQRYGRIINITSVVGEMGNAGQPNYSAAKAGIIGLTKSCARELGSRGITVNAVSPGFIETDMTRNIPQQAKDEYIKKIALGRFGKPEDVAEAVAFLASDRASYITGEVIRVNGGLYM